MIKLLTYLILQSIILSLFASLTYSENRKQNEWKSKISIEWESIERAIGYEVVVKDKKNKIILQQRVEKPSIEFRLPVGSYSLKIGGINKFHKVESWSDWKDLVIKRPCVPEFESIITNSGYTGKNVSDIVVKGNNLLSGGRVYLKRGGMRIYAKDLIYESGRTIRFDIDLEDATEGEYDLVIENPGGLRVVKEGIFSVKSSFLHSSKHYPSYGLRIGIGILYYSIQPEWDSQYYNSYRAINATLGYDLKGFDFFASKKIFRYIGLEFESTYAKFKGREVFRIITNEMNNFMTGGNIYYNTNFDFSLNVIVRVGGGLQFTEAQYDITDEVYNSQDTFYKGGISLEYRFPKSLFIECGVDYCITRFLEQDFKAVRYSFRSGIRFESF